MMPREHLSESYPDLRSQCVSGLHLLTFTGRLRYNPRGQPLLLQPVTTATVDFNRTALLDRQLTSTGTRAR
jgi:hypothetical protein